MAMRGARGTGRRAPPSFGPNRRVVMALGIVAVALGGGLLYGGYALHATYEALAGDGIAAVGSIVSLRTETRTDDSRRGGDVRQGTTTRGQFEYTVYIPTLTFADERGEVHRIEGPAGLKHDYAIGDTRNLRYLPGQHEAARLVSEVDSGNEYALFIIGAPVLLIGVGMLVRPLLARRGGARRN